MSGWQPINVALYASASAKIARFPHRRRGIVMFFDDFISSNLLYPPPAYPAGEVWFRA